MGRIHLGRQDLDELQTRKMKGLKRSRDVAAEAEGEGSEDGKEEDGMGVISDGEERSDDNDDGEGVDIKRPRLE